MQIDKIHTFIDLFDGCFGPLMFAHGRARGQFIDPFDNWIEITDFSERALPHTILFGFDIGRDTPAQAVKCPIASRSAVQLPVNKPTRGTHLTALVLRD